MSKRLTIAVAAALVCAGSALGQGATPSTAPKQPEQQKEAKPTKLLPGDKAPTLSVEKWIKGEPVTGFEKGRVYVVEFWATWCGPCIAVFPHLSELQKEYKSKGVTVIGVNIWERPLNEQTFDKVKAFVEKQGDKMSYTVAFDGMARNMTRTYMEAAGRGGIPSAFIVDKDSRVAWIGHPAEMDEPLKQVVAGTWDSAKARSAAEIEMAVQEVISKNRTDPEAMLTAFDELEARMPAAKSQIDAFRWRIYSMTGQADKAIALARPLIEKAIAEKNAMALNDYSWTMVDPDGPFPKDKVDIELALQAATKAVEFTNEKDGAIIDTLARVYFVKGNIDKAIEWQTKAVAVAPAGMKEQLEEVLDEYKAAKTKG